MVYDYIIPGGVFKRGKHTSRNRKGAKKEPKKGAEKKLDVLRRMEENPMITQVKLMEEFNLTRKQVQKLIKDLREDGLIERQGSNRSGKWVVKK